ncbi:MAG: amidophosphoribosyltransferase [Defluviitaleaceae bacterium]|nr:amidophosphoribosyltransferase [Defluviitaleaceae bacterium]
MDREKPQEECAVFGISARPGFAGSGAGITYNALLSMQHRGQDGAGIAVMADGKIVCHKDIGLVGEVFGHGELERFPDAALAVGHTRYGTTGANKRENAGPFITEYLTGRIATAHNGNITNAAQLRSGLKGEGLNFDATSDSEVISSLMAYYITRERDCVSGVVKAAERLRGAFCLVIMCSNNKLIAVRDPNGFRPLCIGKSEGGMVIASESCALDGIGFEFIRDIAPGEIIVIENGEIISEGVRLTIGEPGRGLCIFEYVYFARPDSIIDGLGVYQARHNMGRELALEHPFDGDDGIVCGAPESGLIAAAGYAAQSGLPLVTGFVLNRYIGRSFIYPTQAGREDAVRLKLNPLTANIAGQKIILVDDSMVRGTTNEKLIRNLKKAGAAEVHMRIASPPYKFACHYGTDIHRGDDLIANKMTIPEIQKKLDANSLGYLSIDGLKRACAPCCQPFCTACFTGDS